MRWHKPPTKLWSSPKPRAMLHNKISISYTRVYECIEQWLLLVRLWIFILPAVPPRCTGGAARWCGGRRTSPQTPTGPIYNSILRFPPSPLHPSHPPILQHPDLLFLPSHAKNLCQWASNSSPESHPKSTGSGGNGSSTSPQPPSANTFPSASTVAKL